MPEGLCGSTRSSQTDFVTKIKSMGSRNRNGLPGRATKKLSEQPRVGLGKLKPRQN